MRELDQWRKDRNAALTSLNLVYARHVFAIHDEKIALIALHKARVECTDISTELRHESVEWLRERGYKRMYGMELPAIGFLPE